MKYYNFLVNKCKNKVLFQLLIINLNRYHALEELIELTEYTYDIPTKILRMYLYLEQHHSDYEILIKKSINDIWGIPTPSEVESLRDIATGKITCTIEDNELFIEFNDQTANLGKMTKNRKFTQYLYNFLTHPLACEGVLATEISGDKHLEDFINRLDRVKFGLTDKKALREIVNKISLLNKRLHTEDDIIEKYKIRECLVELKEHRDKVSFRGSIRTEVTQFANCHKNIKKCFNRIKAGNFSNSNMSDFPDFFNQICKVKDGLFYIDLTSS